MAFADYLDLRTAVIEQVGSADIADRMDRFTLLAESRLNQRLRTRHQMKSRVALTISGRTPLPDDFLELTALHDSDGEIIGQPAYNSDLGFAIEGGHIVGSSGSYRISYYAKIPTLTEGPTATNWLLQNYPSIYLYALSMEAAKAMRQPEDAQAYAAILDAEIANAQSDDSRARYSRARVRVKGPTP